MDSKIIKSLMFPQGWEPDPGDQPFAVPYKSDPKLLPPPTLRELGVERVIGRRIAWATCHWGTYGMGGSGFVALIMEPTSGYPQEALCLTLWGADTWLHLDDKIIDNAFNKSIPAWGYEAFEKAVEGKFIRTFDIQDKSCSMMLDTHVLELKEDPHTRPRYPGGDKGLHELAPQDSLWDAWVITETQLLV